jgi:hypothetical protein
MDENDVRSLVSGWYVRAQQEDEHVTRFVFLWFCFNAWLAYESDEDTDGAMIRWLARQRTEAAQLRAAFDLSMRSSTFVSYVHRLINLSPVVSNGRRRRECRINSLEDSPGIIWCIYQVRCNLFHGTKRARDPRDYELLRTCARILEEWVGCLVRAGPE